MAEGRRSVIRWVLGGGITASIVSFLYPALRFMSPPEVPEAAVDEVNAGKAAELKPNSAKIVKFGSRPVLLIRLDETKWRAFSAVCTHLNCTVQFLDTGHRIWCACHKGF